MVVGFPFLLWLTGTNLDFMRTNSVLRAGNQTFAINAFSSETVQNEKNGIFVFRVLLSC